ncbi:MAG TPA: phage holin family protein [Candidatus Saccharimonadales bacterium]|nr:phage holin family protein [Candidatus Saccharimonadales bacterium]
MAMLRHLVTRFLARWAVSALGLWIASALLGSDHLNYGSSWKTLLISALVLALVNMALKPILVVLSIPAILLSLGLFMLVVNGFIILLVHWIYNPLFVKNIGWAIIAGVILGLVNFLVTKVLEDI